MGKDIDMFDLDIREVSAEEVLEMTYSRSDVCVCETESPSCGGTCQRTCNDSCGCVPA